ncbi:MAG: Asp23/Gls24 family envelope stress response protein [Firmicutes bacterium]|nr:Asp23/Gls24 family envelope stress response protein [Bacillota bacterium]
MEQRTELGETVVHDEVLATIARRAALTVPGVEDLQQRGLPENVQSWVHHALPFRGVRVVSREDGHYDIDLFVVVRYGVRIPSVARALQHAVNNALYEAVERYPDHLVIHVEGVRAVDA